ncbi:MAG: ferrous iron transport protein A [Promethearchaeota archaeon]
MIPLGLVNEGEEAEISHTYGGRGVILRVNELGFYPGSRIRMIRNIKAGPILVELKGCRIAIGRGIAMKIFCKRIKNRIISQENPL